MDVHFPVVHFMHGPAQEPGHSGRHEPYGYEAYRPGGHQLYGAGKLPVQEAPVLRLYQAAGMTVAHGPPVIEDQLHAPVGQDLLPNRLGRRPA